MTVVMTGNVRELQVLGGRLHNKNLKGSCKTEGQVRFAMLYHAMILSEVQDGTCLMCFQDFTCSYNILFTGRHKIYLILQYLVKPKQTLQDLARSFQEFY